MVAGTRTPFFGTAGNAIVVLLMVICLAAAAGGLLFWWTADRPRAKADLPHVQLKEELIGFAHQSTPEIYRRLVRFNDGIALLDQHLERLGRLKEEFPRQTALVSPEIAQLERVKKDLTAALGKVEARIEALFVAHSVDPRQGIARLVNETRSAMEPVDAVYETASEVLQKLTAMEAKPWLEKLKEKLG